MQTLGCDNRLEAWLERLIGDEGLRRTFFATPSDACVASGIPLSWSEMGALLGVPPIYFDEFAKALVGRAAVPALENSDSDWAKQPH